MKIQEEWKLDISRMVGITTDNASNNQKAFKDHYKWISCFGHNLHLAVNKTVAIDKSICSTVKASQNSICIHKITKALAPAHQKTNRPLTSRTNSYIQGAFLMLRLEIDRYIDLPIFSPIFKHFIII